jgi:hypothetical protein
MVLPIPRPAPTAFLYHYGCAGHKLEWLEPIVLAHTLYVPTSTELNDPEEAKPRIKRLSPEGYAQFIHRYIKVILPGLPPEVYENNVRFLRTMSGLHGAESMRDQVSRLLHQSLEGIHIYSMSIRGDSEYMWEKYGCNHAGYCLEFANGGSFGTAKEVIYQDPNELDVSDAAHAVSSWFYMKNQRWWQEQEVRLVLPTAPTGRRYSYQFRPNELTKVILGKDISVTDAAQICTWAGQRRPPLHVARAMYDRHGRLVIED